MHIRTGIQFNILLSLLLGLLAAGALLTLAARPAFAQDGAPGLAVDDPAPPADPEDDDDPTAISLQLVAAEPGATLPQWPIAAFALLALITGAALLRRRPALGH